MAEARLLSRSGRQPPRQTGLLRHLAEVDPVRLRRAELVRCRQQLVLFLHGGRDHVEKDKRGTHRLLENVLCSEGDTTQTERGGAGRSHRQMN